MITILNIAVKAEKFKMYKKLYSILGFLSKFDRSSVRMCVLQINERSVQMCATGLNRQAPRIPVRTNEARNCMMLLVMKQALVD